MVADVAGGDAAAYRRLIDRHAAVVYRLAYRLLGDASEAEDLTQETFLRLWTHAASWRDQASGGLVGWLRRVATNLCLDRLRRRRFTTGVPAAEPADQTPDAHEMLAARDLSRLAVDAVAALPERQKAAIILTYYEDLPNITAAEALGMHLKAFESLLLRARVALRRTMTEAGLSAADLGRAS